jgi:hypothetical protein
VKLEEPLVLLPVSAASVVVAAVVVVGVVVGVGVGVVVGVVGVVVGVVGVVVGVVAVVVVPGVVVPDEAVEPLELDWPPWTDLPAPLPQATVRDRPSMSVPKKSLFI